LRFERQAVRLERFFGSLKRLVSFHVLLLAVFDFSFDGGEEIIFRFSEEIFFIVISSIFLLFSSVSERKEKKKKS